MNPGLHEARWAPGGNVVLDGLTLRFEAGRITALLGRSGSGKSSLLRVLAGLRALDAGRAESGPGPVAFVFQDPALLPWRTARQNVALPVELGAAGDVEAVLAAVGLTAHADKLPAALSGGQRMRVSLARALVSRPKLLLLDEPFAALDRATRVDMHRLVLTAQAELGATVILVTHDVTDAGLLADRVLVVDGPPLRVVKDVSVATNRPRGPVELAGLVAAVEGE